MVGGVLPPDDLAPADLTRRRRRRRRRRGTTARRAAEILVAVAAGDNEHLAVGHT